MAQFGNDLSLGVRTWFRSWQFVFSKGLAIYFIYPIILSILLSMGAVALIREVVDYAMSFVRPFIESPPLDSSSTWEAVKQVFQDIASFAVSFVLWIAAFYTFVKLSKYLILALMSPVMAYLSERTDEILTGKKNPFSPAQFIRDVVRGIAIAVRNLFIELILGWAILAAHLSITLFFPPAAVILAPVIPFVSFGIGAYFFGFSTIDYAFERKRFSLRKSVQIMRSMKGVAVGNGALFSILFYIPLIGVSIATVTCTVAAVLAVHEKEKEGSLNPA